MKHIQWEYKVVTTKSHWRSLEDGEIESALNKLGSRGWEAVSITPYPGSAGTKYVFVLKRPKAKTRLAVNGNTELKVPVLGEPAK